tara:strand:- start:138 stop:671 length:534 start_codon:yes stop_codon:yes gene_type:complete
MSVTLLPQKSPRFTQIQQVSSTQGDLSPAETDGSIQSHVLENAFFKKTSTFSSNTFPTPGTPTSYLSIPKPSSICNFKITATLSQVVPSISDNAIASRQFIQYASTTGSEISTSIVYENQNNYPYPNWFYDASISQINFGLGNDSIILYLPLKNTYTIPIFFFIQGVIKTFVTPTST